MTRPTDDSMTQLDESITTCIYRVPRALETALNSISLIPVIRPMRHCILKEPLALRWACKVQQKEASVFASLENFVGLGRITS
jgi:hypothetical protein